MKRCFLAGLVVLLPVAVTFWVLMIVVDFLTNPFIGWALSFWNMYIPLGIPEGILRLFSQIFILIALFLLTLALGFVGRRLFFNQLIGVGDRLLKKIPLVNKVYTTSKGIVRSFFNAKAAPFRTAVLLPFPYTDSFCLGLIASDAPSVCCSPGPAGADASLSSEMVSVFIPTTPNPTTGYIVMCQKRDLIPLEMKSEDAIRYIVSCGVIQPAEEKEK